jgi:hypothetical protein
MLAARDESSWNYIAAPTAELTDKLRNSVVMQLQRHLEDFRAERGNLIHNIRSLHNEMNCIKSALDQARNELRESELARRVAVGTARHYRNETNRLESLQR